MYQFCVNEEKQRFTRRKFLYLQMLIHRCDQDALRREGSGCNQQTYKHKCTHTGLQQDTVYKVSKKSTWHVKLHFLAL